MTGNNVSKANNRTKKVPTKSSKSSMHSSILGKTLQFRVVQR